jgi:lipoyl(octanoyl) transferase
MIMIARDLGVIAFDEALRYQEEVHAARVQGETEDVLFLLEHAPVITCGRSGKDSDLLVSEEKLLAEGIAVRHVNRGGKLTCHYPGQLVGYVIMDLKAVGMDAHLLVSSLEEMLIIALGEFGIRGERIPSLRGVWVDGRKVASIGIEVKKGVTMHGFSLNIRENKRLYQYFIPCGLTDRETAFLQTCLLGQAPEMNAVKGAVLKAFSCIFGVTFSNKEDNS